MNRDPTLRRAPDSDAPRLLARLPTVLKTTGLVRSTICRWTAVASFFGPARLGPRAKARRWSDLDL